MSNTLQGLDAIKPLKKEAAKSDDPVQVEYEEGKKHLEAGEYGQAAVALHNALLGFEEKKDDAGIANASNQLGHVCLARGDYDNALGHYRKAHEIVDRMNDRMSVLAVLKKIVEVQRKQQDRNSAISTCLDMVDLYHDNRDPQGTVMTLELMAEIYTEAGEPAKAADTYRTIASIHRNFKHTSIAESFEEKAAALERSN